VPIARNRDLNKCRSAHRAVTVVLCCSYDIDLPLTHNINFSKLYKALGVGPPNFPPIYPVFYRTSAQVSACTVDQYSTARLPARSKWAREANGVKALRKARRPFNHPTDFKRQWQRASWIMS